MKPLFTLNLLLISITLSAQQTFIHCGNLVDVKRGKVVSEQTIVVEDDLVVDVKNGFIEVPSSSNFIDLKNSTVLPGLFDMHVHLESETSKESM